MQGQSFGLFVDRPHPGPLPQEREKQVLRLKPIQWLDGSDDGTIVGGAPG